MLTLSEELESGGQLEEVGGSAYLTGLINQVPSSLNAEAYAQIVASNAARRAMIQAANQIAALAYDEKNEIESATEQAAKALEQAVMHASGNALVPIAMLPLRNRMTASGIVELRRRTARYCPAAFQKSGSQIGQFKPARCTPLPRVQGRARPASQ